MRVFVHYTELSPRQKQKIVLVAVDQQMQICSNNLCGGKHRRHYLGGDGMVAEVSALVRLPLSLTMYAGEARCTVYVTVAFATLPRGAPLLALATRRYTQCVSMLHLATKRRKGESKWRYQYERHWLWHWKSPYSCVPWHLGGVHGGNRYRNTEYGGRRA